MKRVFVTGGAGYVGSHGCKAFADAGWDVTVFDNLSRGWRDAVRWGPLVEGDLLDRPTLERALAEARPDLVVHFAALAYVGESQTDPAPYFRVNTAGTLNLLESMRAVGLRDIVVSSTCATYGAPDRLPIDEDQHQSPINPYGWSKLMAERMLQAFGAAYGLNSVALRYFNAAGCDPDGEIGERHQPETHAMPLAIAAALDPSGTFVVNGLDYPTPDGSAVRDYVHVSDLARAHVLAGDFLLREGGVHAFNLGTGRGTSVLEMIDAVGRSVGRKIPITLGDRRPGDPPALVASPARAAEKLGWTARMSDLDTIVDTALAWMRKDAHR